MKMLKKIGACAVAGAMAMSCSAFAATVAIPTTGDTVPTATYTAAAGDVAAYWTVSVPYTTTDADQVTMLACIGGEIPTTIAYATTAYIDQEAKDADGFTFKINASRLEGASNIAIRVGGTDATADNYVLALPAITPSTPITSEEITGALITDGTSTITNAYGMTNAGIAKLDISDKVSGDTPKIDLTKQKVLIDGVSVKYTVYNGVTKLVGLVDTTVSSHVITFEDLAEGETSQLLYGDVNLNSSVNAADMSTSIAMIGSGVSLANLADYSYIAADIDGGNAINAADISSIIGLIGGTITVPGAAE